MIRPLDLDISIYRDRVQVVHRAGDAFVDQRAEYPFSDARSVVAHPAYLEDTIVRAVRRILSGGGFSLRDPIAHVVRCEGCLGKGERKTIESALAGLGIADVLWELDDDQTPQQE